MGVSKDHPLPAAQGLPETAQSRATANQRFLEILREGIPIFQVLSDVHRQDILLLLSNRGEMTVNAITEMLTLSRPAVSHHLKLLRQVGIVSSRKQAKEVYCHLSIARPLSLLKELTHIIESTCTLR